MRKVAFIALGLCVFTSSAVVAQKFEGLAAEGAYMTMRDALAEANGVYRARTRS